MESGLKRDIRVYSDADALTRAVARALVDTLNALTAGAERCSLVLAGGDTPRALYRLLGSVYRDAIPWEKVRIFWGDERYVPADDPRSNYGMAKDGLLSHVRVPPENVHPMPTNLPDPDAAARAYEKTLRAHFPDAWPRFDVALLGLGVDGHTASLFPGSPALEEPDRWVVAVRAPIDPPVRLTLTLPALNSAARIWFLVAGRDKAPALQQTLKGVPGVRTHPAAGVRPADGAVTWWIDEAAAALLGQPVRVNHRRGGRNEGERPT